MINGLSLVETKALQDLIDEVTHLKSTVLETISELKSTKKPYLTINEVVDFTGLSRSSIHKFRDEIGHTTSGGCVRFKRKDVEEFMEENYFKAKKGK